MTQSPLAEAQTDSLEELFSRDPEGLQQQDLETMVAQFRFMRQKWQQDEAQGKTRGKASLKAQNKTPTPPINLEDLGL